jgi:5-methyltetrahydropteroyltriglutamate--homocysteine methyltransferase
MVLTANLGFPRVGADRELKRALERHWRGDISKDELQTVARELRARHWRLQQSIGIDHIPSNDFSLYDHVLDTAWMVGSLPEGFPGDDGGGVGGSNYFALARGGTVDGHDVQALEMTKWFDTNYHYLVPQLRPGQTFRTSSAKPVGEFLEAMQLGIRTRPVLLGPVSFLLLAKGVDEPLALLPPLLDAYESILADLAAAGATWIQIDEPVLALDLGDDERRALVSAFVRLAAVSPDLRLVVTSYFAGLGSNTEVALQLPVAAVHLDLVRAPEQLDDVLARVPDGQSLSLGVVDGRNVWRSDLDQALGTIERAVDRLGPDRVLVAPSCSLLHLPFDVEREAALDPELRGWLAFAEQRLGEVAVLGRAVRAGREAVAEELADAHDAVVSHRSSPRVHRSDVADRLAAITPAMKTRSPFVERASAQAERVPLPQLPTTTIGSFPQTAEVRALRARLRRGDIDEGAYDTAIKTAIREAIELQEDLGVDVLVHGEFERNDMVEYFGEQLDGFTFTQHGWVQSYGSRCVKPPIIYGDVRRPAPMTVRWSTYAQSLTDKPVKGMLTGPVTLLQWSFVRSDQPRSVTARQLALAIRDEVADLEAAGIPIIQIDEPALREGLPLRRSQWREYLSWAVEAFRLASSGVHDETQIHTHMCYSEFNDILESIADLDADVISIEASRSGMELLQAFRDFKYPNDIGPGVWDIHSPRVPPTEEMVGLLERAETVLDPRHLWVNPDCGLKTRGWEEVVPGLANLVAAARTVREGAR